MARKKMTQPSEEQIRTATGKDWLDWFVVLDVWEEGNHDQRQIQEFLVNQRGLAPYWAQVVASQYISRRI